MFWDHYTEDCMEQLQDQLLKLIVLEMEEMYLTLIFVMIMVSHNLIRLCIWMFQVVSTVRTNIRMISRITITYIPQIHIFIIHIKGKDTVNGNACSTFLSACHSHLLDQFFVHVKFLSSGLKVQNVLEVLRRASVFRKFHTEISGV